MYRIKAGGMNMKDKKKSRIIASIAYIVAGLILLIFPNLTAKLVVFTVATGFLIFGLFRIVAYFMSNPESANFGMATGLFCIAVSIFTYCSSELIITVIPIILGFFILLSGALTMQQTMDIVRVKEKGWVPMLVVAGVNIVLAILCLANPFASSTVLMTLIGAGLLFSGISDIVASLYFGDK